MKAELLFHQPPHNYNCAQSVVKAWQERFNIPEQVIEEFRANGGGRAEDGICGALYGAFYLLKNDPEKRKEIEKQFNERIGSVYCRQIKKENKHSCQKCVHIADTLLESMLQSADDTKI
ncbi:MAG: C-GCAxxG-C-C family (seleno)protein [Bacteroidota bacterium]|nr:C-GCAxxG-C-C family (seleno)protein [Bacteroidota bacterium]